MSAQPPLSDEVQRLFLIFKQAIEDERRAQDTYREAMTITEDPLLLAVFKTLHDDEARHEQELVRRYETFRRHFLATSDKNRSSQR